MKKVLIMTVSIIGVFLLGMFTQAAVMWYEATKNLTPEELKSFDNLWTKALK